MPSKYIPARLGDYKKIERYLDYHVGGAAHLEWQRDFSLRATIKQYVEALSEEDVVAQMKIVKRDTSAPYNRYSRSEYWQRVVFNLVQVEDEQRQKDGQREPAGDEG